MDGNVFFVILNESERSKLQLDLAGIHDRPLLVAHLRSRLKQELHCSALDLVLFRAKDHHAPSWKTITDEHCEKLDDDEEPFRGSCVYVIRKRSAAAGGGVSSHAQPPAQAAPPPRGPSPRSHHRSPPPDDRSLYPPRSPPPRRTGRDRPVIIRRMDSASNSPPRGSHSSYDRAPPPYWHDPEWRGEFDSRRDVDRRYPGEMEKRRRVMPDDRGPGPGDRSKLEVSQLSLFKLRPGRWAPVVHNLISKQDFLSDLYEVVSKHFRERGGTILPFQIDSLGEVCASHDVRVPTSYSLKSVKESREFRSLSATNRQWLEPVLDNDPEADVDPNSIADVETTVCFLKIGNERLLVFDWYVYALEHVADYRKQLPAGRTSPIFYLYGQPRIGKSICILFLAIAAGFCGETVYFYCDSKVWTIRPDRPVECVSLAVAASEPPETNSTTPRPFVFAELRLREFEGILKDLEKLAKNKNAIVVASGVPEKNVIEERRVKGDGAAPASEDEGAAADTPALLFVPPPAWHELCSLKVLSYPGINFKEFVFRYFLFGPIPRNLISENGFDGVLDSLRRAHTHTHTPPWQASAPDFVNSDPSKLTTLIMPVNGAVEGGCSKQINLQYISRAAEAILSSQ